jgi:hypothetical protein
MTLGTWEIRPGVWTPCIQIFRGASRLQLGVCCASRKPNEIVIEPVTRAVISWDFNLRDNYDTRGRLSVSTCHQPPSKKTSLRARVTFMFISQIGNDYRPGYAMTSLRAPGRSLRKWSGVYPCKLRSVSLSSRNRDMSKSRRSLFPVSASSTHGRPPSFPARLPFQIPSHVAYCATLHRAHAKQFTFIQGD